MPSVELRAPATSSFPRPAFGLGEEARRGEHHHDPDGQVDEEPDPPGEPVRDDAAEHEPEAGADTGDGGVVGDRARALGPFGEAGRQKGER
jgi:hypothetical protein